MAGRPRTSVPPRAGLVVFGVLVWLGAAPRPGGAVLTCGSCEQGMSLTCPDSFDMQYTVSVNPYNNELNGSLHLKCDYIRTNLNFTLLQGCSFPRVIFVKIEQCPLFGEPLASVLSKIGVNVDNVFYLLWEHSHSVEGGLQSWHFDNLPNLISLQIQNNNFNSFPRELFKKTPMLRKLYVTGNYIDELPDDFLSYTPKVAMLDLGYNQLKRLPEHMLDNVPSLAVLNLWSNQLSSIPPRLLIRCPQLTTVLLNSNKLTSLAPNLFTNLTNLQHVDIQQNNLTTLPESVFEGCVNVTQIVLAYNKISYLPPALFQGTSLQIVNLEYNELVNLTGTLTNLTTLQNVILRKNAFETLHKDMFIGSSNIIKLDLQANAIKTLEEGIFKDLSDLKIILLNSNSIDELPPALFRNCISLSRIYMQNNSLTILPHDTFPVESDIEMLDISFNELTLGNDFYQPNPLNRLTRLKELSLAGNKISNIFDEALFIFTQLRRLDLRNNEITSITNRELEFISENVTLLLENNKIANISITRDLGFGSSDKYISVSLQGNPINCDCKMYNFFKIAELAPPFLANKPFNLIAFDAQKTYCSLPHEYTNVSLAKIDYTKVVCEFQCSLECMCHIRPHDNFNLMDCSNLSLRDSPTLTPDFTASKNKFYLSLDLSSNEYENISFLANSEFQNLVHLNLSNNTVPILIETDLPKSLKYLDLSHNNLTSMSDELVSRLNSSGMTLHLAGNPWACDCGLKSFHEFIRDNYELVRDRPRVVCMSGGAPIDELTVDQLCSPLQRPVILTAIGVGAIVLLLAAVLVTAAWYRHKELVKAWLYAHKLCLWAVTEEDIDADKTYDAFVSYSHKDEDFVHKQLLPVLESSSPPYRVCEHTRDWVPGEYIANQIVASVRDSRRTIIVLSKNFIESSWGEMEVKAAHSQALKDKTNRIIVVIYGDAPRLDELDGELKLYVSTKTYLKADDPRFVERLRYAMPHAKYARHPPRGTKVDKLELVKPAPLAETKGLEE